MGFYGLLPMISELFAWINTLILSEVLLRDHPPTDNPGSENEWSVSMNAFLVIRVTDKYPPPATASVANLLSFIRSANN